MRGRDPLFCNPLPCIQKAVQCFGPGHQPLAVLVQGVPDDAGVSPAFVSASMWPHHLAFVGFVLVGASAIIELAPHLGRSRGAPASSATGAAARGGGGGEGAIDPVASWPMPARIAVVAIVGLGAVVASVAVLSA